jgi:hypothetical protein
VTGGTTTAKGGTMTVGTTMARGSRATAGTTMVPPVYQLQYHRQNVYTSPDNLDLF